MSHYETAWWTLRLPDEWAGEEDADCHTFTSEDGVGALQVSAYRKEEGSVTEADLREFAGDIPLRAVTAGEFTGFRTRFSQGEAFWLKWWLCAGRTMLHVTYNCALDERDEDEEAVVESILRSLCVAK